MNRQCRSDSDEQVLDADLRHMRLDCTAQGAHLLRDLKCVAAMELEAPCLDSGKVVLGKSGDERVGGSV